MKSLMLSTAILAASAFVATAQETTAPATTAPAETTVPAPTGTVLFRADADPMEIRASELIGMRIYASEGEIGADASNGVQEGWEDIGEVNDVILTRDGSAEAVLVDIGGILGIGERQVAVDMSVLRFVADDATADDIDDYFLVMTAARADLEAAPEYVNPATTPAAGTATAPEGTVAAPVDGTMTTDAMTRDGYVASDAATLTADRLEGATVYDTTDASIGTIKELVLSADGQISNAIVDVGGFLGIGAKPVALTLEQMQILQQDGGDDIRVYVPMTKEQLEGLPTYEG